MAVGPYEVSIESPSTRDRVYPLDVATAITYDDRRYAIGPLVDPSRGVHLVHADGAIWISVHGFPHLSVNKASLHSMRAPHPLFDGDVRAIVRLGR